jgi:Ca2+/Na+ antiporter
MLYGLGFIILLMSTCMESESVLVPLTVAIIGIGLMMLGTNRRETKNGR